MERMCHAKSLVFNNMIEDILYKTEDTLPIKIIKNSKEYKLIGNEGMVDSIQFLTAIMDTNAGVITTDVLRKIFNFEKEEAYKNNTKINDVVFTCFDNDDDYRKTMDFYDISQSNYAYGAYIKDGYFVIDLNESSEIKLKEFKAQTFVYMDIKNNESIEEAENRLKDVLAKIQDEYRISFLMDFNKQEIRNKE